MSSSHTPDDEERASPAAGVDGDALPGAAPRRRRRVTTPPPEGSDPTPAPEPPRGTGTENDERLKADKPPHY